MNYEELTPHYLELAEQMLDEAFGENRAQWIDRIEAELPKIRSVFAWLREQRDVNQGLRLAYLLQELWFEEQYTEEGLGLIQDFLAMGDVDEPSTLHAMALDLAGGFALSLNNFELASSLKNKAVVILRKLNSPGQLGYALLHLGHLVKYAEGNYDEAKAIYQEALEIFTNLADQAGVAHAIANLAGVALELRDYTTAQTLVNDSLQRYSELDFQWDLALTLGIASGVAVAHGEFDRAVRLAAASAAHRKRIGVSLPDKFRSRFERIEKAALNGLNEEQPSAVWAAGQTMTLADAVDYALHDNFRSS
jgi:tetratricopeptide (TPR) repeat protein